MQRSSFFLIAFALGLAAGGCDAAQPEETGTLVVEAFFEAGVPLDTLILRQTQSLSVQGERAAEDAAVRLQLGRRSVRYRPAGPPGRYVPASRTVAEASTPFALTVEWNSQTATAEGHLPPPIRFDTVVVHVPEAPVRTVLLDSLRRDSLDIPAKQGYIYPIEVDLAWTAPAAPARSYWIQARLRPFNPFSSRIIGFFLQPEEVFREQAAVPGGGTGRARRWSGVYAVPADSAEAPLSRHRLRVALVRADSAYARFARTRNAPDQREPDGNVRGALGIAAGVAIDQRTLEIGD